MSTAVSNAGFQRNSGEMHGSQGAINESAMGIKETALMALIRKCSSVTTSTLWALTHREALSTLHVFILFLFRFQLKTLVFSSVNRLDFLFLALFIYSCASVVLIIPLFMFSLFISGLFPLSFFFFFFSFYSASK